MKMNNQKINNIKIKIKTKKMQKKKKKKTLKNIFSEQLNS